MFRLLSLAISCALLLLSQDLQHSIQQYRSYLVSHPNDAVAHSNLGVLLSHAGQYDQAAAEYKRALQLEPTNASIRLNLGLAFYKSGRIPEATEIFEAARKLAPDNLQLVLLLADCRLRMGDNRRVIALLEPLEKQNADNLAISYLLGTALIRDHQLDEGQKRVDRILRNGDSAEAHLLLGNQMFAAGDYPAAVKELQRAVQLNPALPGVQSLYGQALLYTGDPDAAAEAFRKELATDPNNFDSNLHLTEILIARKRRAEAEPLLQRALRVRPQARSEVLAAGNPDENTADQRGPAPGELAPALLVTRPASKKPLELRNLRNNGPVFLVFGSYTCPNFRAAAGTLNRLYSKYGDRIPFYLIYIREAHSDAGWQSTRNEREGITLAPAVNVDERAAHASLCVRKLHIEFHALLDDNSGTAAKAYAAWPSRAYVIDKNGRIVFRTGLTELEFKPAKLEAALQAALR